MLYYHNNFIINSAHYKSQAIILVYHYEVCTGVQVSGIKCRVSSVGYRVSGIGCRVSGVGYQVSGVGYRVSGIGYQVLVVRCGVL